MAEYERLSTDTDLSIAGVGYALEKTGDTNGVELFHNPVAENYAQKIAAKFPGLKLHPDAALGPDEWFIETWWGHRIGSPGA